MSFTLYTDSVIKYKLDSKTKNHFNYPFLNRFHHHPYFHSPTFCKKFKNKKESLIKKSKEYCINNNYNGFLINMFGSIYIKYIDINKIEPYNNEDKVFKNKKKYAKLLHYKTDLYVYENKINIEEIKEIKTDSILKKNYKGPNFLIIGIQKSGTSYLKHILRSHPDLYLPKNELHFFDSRYNK